jgi:uncharacterized membrane protein YkoI
MRNIGIIALAFGELLLADQGETKVQFKDLPSAVQTAAKEHSRGATVRGYSKDMEDGKTEYEVQLLSAGKTKDISMDENGAVLGVEQQVDLASLPAAAKNGLKKQAGDGRILKVESVTQGGNVSYEAVVMRGGKKSEIAITSDGKPLKAD